MVVAFFHPLQEEAAILRELGYYVTGTWCNQAEVDPANATELVDKIVLTFKVRDPSIFLRRC